MQKHQLLALAAFITSLANDAEGVSTETSPTTGEATTAPKKPRGRAAAAQVSAETVAEVEATAPAASAPTKTYEDMQKLIEPWVKGARGAEIKAILHKSFNGIAVKTMDPKDYAAFEVEVLKLSPVVPPIATDASDY